MSWFQKKLNVYDISSIDESEVDPDMGINNPFINQVRDLEDFVPIHVKPFEVPKQTGETIVIEVTDGRSTSNGNVSE